jgi:hypothetical protein
MAVLAVLASTAQREVAEQPAESWIIGCLYLKQLSRCTYSQMMLLLAK